MKYIFCELYLEIINLFKNLINLIKLAIFRIRIEIEIKLIFNKILHINKNYLNKFVFKIIDFSWNLIENYWYIKCLTINWSTQFVFANSVTNTKAVIAFDIERNVYFSGYKVNENKHFKYLLLKYMLHY